MYQYYRTLVDDAIAFSMTKSQKFFIQEIHSISFEVNFSKCKPWITEVMFKLNFLAPNINLLAENTLSLLDAPIFNPSIYKRSDR